MPTNRKRIDLSRMINRLVEEKKRLDLVIASLEGLNDGVDLESVSGEARIRRRRGRKSMSLEERRLVAERMRLYWQTRKAMREPEMSESAKQAARTTESGA